jgi:hypothetical protein
MKDNLIIASKLLNDFNNFLGNRSTTFLTQIDGMLNNIVEWHFKVWKKEQEYLGIEGELGVWSIYSNLSRTIASIFQQIETRALKERASFPFFKILQDHAEKYKEESVSSRYYNESLLNTFYQVFFNLIYDAPQRYNIWNHYFPNEWKVTKSNLQNKENITSGISLNIFFEWASRRIWQTKDENDLSLNDVSSNLFPDVDPILWARILIFIFSPYGEDRLRSVIERPWNFGFIGRTRVYFGDQEEDMRRMYEVDERNTFELIYFLFKKEFSMINLKSYIEALEKLSFSEKSEEERKRLTLLSLFREMLLFVTKIEQSNI